MVQGTSDSINFSSSPKNNIFGLLIAGLFLIYASTVQSGVLLLPKTALEPGDVAVVVNDRDPLSLKIGRYYMARRGIPEKNFIHVEFPPQRGKISIPLFQKQFKRAFNQTPKEIQAFVLTWARPYRVGCMSITSAFATGFDRRYCAVKEDISKPCGITRYSPYFNSSSLAPYKDHKLRPTMALAAFDFDRAKQLIDRGVVADGTFPKGTAYLLETSDKNRSVRARLFPSIKEKLGYRIPIRILKQEAIKNKKDVLFYFTGKTRVEGLKTLRFLPGAAADHLTSAGGQMRPSDKPGKQMSAIRWLEAGATGSYGTVVEPCNYLTKFPHPGILMEQYLNGASLMEAYWKSVAWPGEGLFIGEPLSRPFGRRQLTFSGDRLTFNYHGLPPGQYRIMAANAAPGPYQFTGRKVTVFQRGETITLTGLKTPFYLLEPASERLPRR